MTQSEKLKTREIKVEADELMDASHPTVRGDAEYVMRKVVVYSVQKQLCRTYREDEVVTQVQ
jgi:hypothetical protein